MCPARRADPRPRAQDLADGSVTSLMQAVQPTTIIVLMAAPMLPLRSRLRQLGEAVYLEEKPAALPEFKETLGTLLQEHRMPVGAAQVYVLAAETAQFPSPLGVALQQRSNVEVLEGYAVTEVLGEEIVEAVLAVCNGQLRRLAVERVFVALGVVPNSALVRELMATDANGFIQVNAYHETSQPGLYAAGDVSTICGEQVMTAIGDRARAALSACDYLLAQSLVADQAAAKELRIE